MIGFNFEKQTESRVRFCQSKIIILFFSSNEAFSIVWWDILEFSIWWHCCFLLYISKAYLLTQTCDVSCIRNLYIVQWALQPEPLGPESSPSFLSTTWKERFFFPYVCFGKILYTPKWFSSKISIETAYTNSLLGHLDGAVG